LVNCWIEKPESTDGYQQAHLLLKEDSEGGNDGEEHIEYYKKLRERIISF
jgi:hypothetical protein